MASKTTVEEGSVDKTVPIVIPSPKTHTVKEWFEFAFTDRVYGKTGCRETMKTVVTLIYSTLLAESERQKIYKNMV